jgi:hypothetical protein
MCLFIHALEITFRQQLLHLTACRSGLLALLFASGHDWCVRVHTGTTGLTIAFHRPACRSSGLHTGGRRVYVADDVTRPSSNQTETCRRSSAPRLASLVPYIGGGYHAPAAQLHAASL